MTPRRMYVFYGKVRALRKASRDTSQKELFFVLCGFGNIPLYSFLYIYIYMLFLFSFILFVRESSPISLLYYIRLSNKCKKQIDLSILIYIYIRIYIYIYIFIYKHIISFFV